MGCKRVLLAEVTERGLRVGMVGVDAEDWPHRVVDASPTLGHVVGLAADGLAKLCEAKGWRVARLVRMGQ